MSRSLPGVGDHQRCLAQRINTNNGEKRVMANTNLLAKMVNLFQGDRLWFVWRSSGRTITKNHPRAKIGYLNERHPVITNSETPIP